jgi:SAM-dependent methyltransferase
MEKDWIAEHLCVEKQFTNNYLIPWAYGLQRDFPILDLMGGKGIESSILDDLDLATFNIDVNSNQITEAKNKYKLLGISSALPFAANSISGIICKDAWVFQPPEVQINIIREVKRVLIPGGTMLFQSQLGDAYRVHYIPDGSRYPQIETFSNDEKWEECLKVLDERDYIFSQEYVVTPGSMSNLCGRVGLSWELLDSYSYSSQIASENRWIPGRSGFIGQITVE